MNDSTKILIALVVFYLVRRAQKRKKLTNLNQTMNSYGGGGGGFLDDSDYSDSDSDSDDDFSDNDSDSDSDSDEEEGEGGGGFLHNRVSKITYMEKGKKVTRQLTDLEKEAIEILKGKNKEYKRGLYDSINIKKKI